MPKLLTTAFASNTSLRTNIQESQGVDSNSATYEFGFPKETMTRISEGGKPPKGEDMNGILYDLSDNIVFQTKGGHYTFDPIYAEKINGYPKNAILQLTNGDLVVNITDGNKTNPNVSMLGWRSIYSALTNNIDNNPMFKSVEIKPEYDLNSYMKEGNYYANAATVPTLKNCPTSVGFSLSIRKMNDSDQYLKFTLNDRDNRTFERGSAPASEGGFRDWVETSSIQLTQAKKYTDDVALNTLNLAKDDAQEKSNLAEKNTKDYVDQNPMFKSKRLSTGMDLHSFFPEGEYYSDSSTSSTLINCPTTASFNLKVWRINTNTEYLIYTIKDRLGKTFECLAAPVNGGGFTEWVNSTLEDSKKYTDEQTKLTLKDAKEYADKLSTTNTARTKLITLTGDYNLTNDEANFELLIFGGSITQNVNVVFPRSKQGKWIVQNGTNTPYTIYLSVAGQTPSPMPLPSYATLYVFSGGGQLVDATRGKANLESPVFTGVPSAPTQPVGTKNKTIATTEFVDNAVKSGVNANYVWQRSDNNSKIEYDKNTKIVKFRGTFVTAYDKANPRRIRIQSLSNSLITFQPLVDYDVIYIDFDKIPANGAIDGSNFSDIVKVGNYGKATFTNKSNQVAILKYDHVKNTIVSCNNFIEFSEPTPPTPEPSISPDLLFSKTKDRLSVYFKSSDSSEKIRVQMWHQIVPKTSTSVSANSDLWRVYTAYAVNATTFAEKLMLVNSGEWECAIKHVEDTQEPGVTKDFVGGFHGDELMSIAYFMVDGVYRDQDFLQSSEIPFKELQLIQKSTIYYQGTDSQLAEHFKIVTFNSSGVNVKQKLNILASNGLNVASSGFYTAMLPIMRNQSSVNVTNKSTRSDNYFSEIDDNSQLGFPKKFSTLSDGFIVKQWGDAGYSSRSIINKGTVLDASKNLYIQSANTGTDYNKLYVSPVDVEKTAFIEKGKIIEFDVTYNINKV